MASRLRPLQLPPIPGQPDQNRGGPPVALVTVDGVTYAPAIGPLAPRIGVAITTRNRRAMFTKTVAQWRKHLPAGATIIIVDDASDTPAPEATRRFDTQQGIAKAKNACIAELMKLGVTHLFLADDDCYPIKDGWAQHYIDAGEPHLMYLFKGDDKPATRYDDGTTYALAGARGCLLYLHADTVNRIGGMRPQFGIWGHEHVEYSTRAWSAGLTAYPFMDACGSADYIHSCDENYRNEPGFNRAVPIRQRVAECERNDKLLAAYYGSRDYVEYRDLPNLAITTLFTKTVDPQRGKKLAADTALVGKWLASLQNCTPVVLCDEIDSPDPVYVKVPTGLNPYLQRWISLHRYLRTHQAAWVWATDGTDVEMLHEPFAQMAPGTLYVGFEPTVVGIPWMGANHPGYVDWIADNADRQLLNAGVVGGDHATLTAFTHAMAWEISNRGNNVGIGDMAALNYVCYSDAWRDRIVWGSRWTTLFKHHETNNHSAWQHK